MNKLIWFIYDVCGLLLIAFILLAVITVVWNLFVSINYLLFASFVLIIRMVIEWKFIKMKK
jgi:hypothetical protein